MDNKPFDALYGKKGIDTSYERMILKYRPELGYEKEKIRLLIRPEVQQSIERSRTFTISQNLLEYEEIINDIDQMMKDIENRNPKNKIEELKGMLKEGDFQGIILFEKENSKYDQTGDYELYTMLYQMRSSAQVRQNFLDERFRTQITNETDIEKVQEAEKRLIDEWEQLEAYVAELYSIRAEIDDDYEDDADDQYLSGSFKITYDLIEKIERQKRDKELFHTTLADTSYVHRNRFFLFLEVVEKAKILVYHSSSLIDFNLKEFILRVSELGDFSAPKSHLLLEFKKIREEHDALKGRLATIDAEKENFASEKNYIYQQLETKTIEPIKNWLYDQEENISGSLDIFSKYMTDSMLQTRSQYEETLSDMINFYKSESDFYSHQVLYLKKKEEIRKFYSILTDLEELEEIQEEWVEEYLKANGYSV